MRRFLAGILATTMVFELGTMPVALALEQEDTSINEVLQSFFETEENQTASTSMDSVSVSTLSTNDVPIKWVQEDFFTEELGEMGIPLEEIEPEEEEQLLPPEEEESLPPEEEEEEDHSPVIVSEGTWGDFSYGVQTDGTLSISGYSGSDTTITIPSSINGTPVTAIASSAFRDNNTLKEVIIPEGVSTIGYYAFRDCNSLEKVVIPSTATSFSGNGKTFDSPKLKTVGTDSSSNIVISWTNEVPDSAFRYCDSITDVTFPDSIITVGNYVLQDCSRLTTLHLPTGCRTIGSSAMYGCTALEEVTIPSLVTSIGNSAFYDCDTLKEVIIPEGVSTIGYYAFRDCNLLEKVVIPSTATTFSSYGKTFDSPKLKTVGTDSSSNIVISWTNEVPDSVFRYCDSITDVTFPDSIITVGNYVLQDCSRLTTLHLPTGLRTIGNSAMYGCTALEEVTIPSQVASIGNYAFYDCDTLKEVIIPEGVTSISYSAFRDCDLLEKVVIPSTATTFSSYGKTFDSPKLKTVGTDSNSNIVISWTNEVPDSVFRYCASITDVTFPDSIITAGNYALQDCSSLTTLHLPTGLRTIGNSAMYGCTALEEVTIPSQVASIGNYAFYDCDTLKEVIIPEGVTSISYSAFRDCDLLEKVVIPSTATTFSSYGKTFDSPKLKTVGTDSSSNIVFSWTNAVPDYAFRYCSSITDVTFPDSIITVGNYVLQDCSRLTTLHLPTGLRTIGNSAMSGCTALEEVTIPSQVASIGNYAFYDCDKLKEVIIPEGVTSIGSYSFAYCESFTKIDIPSSITSIPSNAFSYCTSLTAISLPESITTIGSNAFSYCTSLTAISLPESITTIGSNAFSNCTGLTYAYIPSTCTSISSTVFSSCPSLVICSEAYSTAIIYAIDNEISFAQIEPGLTLTNDIFDRSQTSYTGTTSTLGVNGLVTLTTKYHIHESAWNSLSNTSISSKIPSYYDLNIASVAIDGTNTTDYTYHENTGKLTIPISNREGTITFTANMAGNGDLLSYSVLNYKQNGKTSSEIIDIVNEEMKVMTLDTSATTSLAQTSLNGIAPAGEKVSIYVDDVLVLTTESSKAGYYYGTISLGTPADGQKFTIEARSQQLSTTKTVTYQEGVPSLESFMFYADVNELKGYDLYAYDLQGIRPNITHIGSSYPMRFEIKFTNPELVKNLKVVSTRSNVALTIPAEYDEERGIFIAEGYFDKSNLTYVPGAISLKYDIDYSSQSSSEALQNQIDNIIDKLSDKVSMDDLTIKNQTSDLVTVEFDMNTFIPDSTESTLTEVSLGTTQLNKHSGESQTEFIARITREKVADGYTVSGGSSSSSGSLVFTKLEAGKLVVEGLDKLDESLSHMSVTLEALDLVDDFGGDLGTILSGLALYGNLVVDCESLYYQINTSNMSESEKETARARADALLMVTYGLRVGLMVAGVVGGTSIASTLILMVASDYIGDYIIGPLQELGIAMIFGFSFKINWHIDPSGYVYDIETLERISGVETTVYCVMFDIDTDDDSFWENMPTEEEYGEKWDSTEYNQANPLYTDGEGRYAWDVPEGWWRVNYEHTDYETAWSEWLPVPPPQLEVNVGLTYIGGRDDTCNITLNYQDDNTVDTALSSKTDGTLSSLPTPSKTGYVFDGWYDAQTGGNKITTSTIFSKDSTIYAQWTKEDTSEPTPTTHTVTFNPNGGTVSTTTSTTNSTTGTLSSLPVPTKTGYTFDGWFDAQTGGNKITTSTVFSKDTTIYAQWTKEDTSEPNANTYPITGTTVNYPTQEQIALFHKEYNLSDAETSYVSWEEMPSFAEPYSSGVLSDATLNHGLDTTNYVRYIAGLTYDIPLNTSHSTQAQDATFILALLDDGLTHYPSRPSQLSDSKYDSLFSSAALGAKSNLAYSWSSSNHRKTVHSMIVNQWLEDGDASNIDRVGHRRWVLNPSLGAVGFGSVLTNNTSYGAMYAHDRTDTTATATGVSWPAQNMPVDLFGSVFPWSFSTGTTITEDVTVTLTRLNDNKQWTFDQSDKDLEGKYFNVDNGSYGQTGCIIFRPDPKEITYSHGDVFHVSITGGATASYCVSFFDVDTVTASTSLTPSTTATSFTYVPEAQTPVTSLTLNKTSLTLDLNSNKTETLLATVLPNYATHSAVTWTSSEPNVATVDSKTGEVVGVAIGNTTITATADGKTATCSVTVTDASATGAALQLDSVYITDNTTLTVEFSHKGELDNFGISVATSEEDAKNQVGFVQSLGASNNKTGLWFTGTMNNSMAILRYPDPSQMLYVVMYGVDTEGNELFSNVLTLQREVSATDYVISFDSAGGNSIPSQTTDTDGKLTSLFTPIRTGYTFSGWFTTATGGTKITTSTVFKQNTTVYAQWTSDTDETTKEAPFTIAFSPMGGTVSDSTKDTSTSGTLSSLPTATRDNYEFQGWYTLSAGGTKISTSTVFTEDVTVFAQWKRVLEDEDDGDTDSGDVEDEITDNTSIFSGLGTSSTNGTTVFSKNTPKTSEKVYMNVTLPTSHAIDSITMFDESGNLVKFYRDMSSDAYYFYQPSSFVTVDITTRNLGLYPYTSSYSDVPSSEWYEQYIRYITDKGVMTSSSNIFSPEIDTNRGTIAQALLELSKESALAHGSNTTSFKDLSSSDYWNAVTWCTSRGIMSGYDSNTFAPNDLLTREQFATALSTFAKTMGLPNTATTYQLDRFHDTSEISLWATSSVAWCVENGLLAGFDGYLKPQDTLSRAELSTMLSTFHKKFLA